MNFNQGIAGDSIKSKPPFVSSRLNIAGINLHPKGEVSIEGKVSNYQDPWQFGPTSYVRTKMNASIYTFGLPMVITAYLTTEDRLLYRGSYFRVSYDNKRFREDIMSGYRDSIINKNKKLTSTFSDFTKTKNNYLSIEKQDQAVQNKIQNLSQYNNNIKEGITTSESKIDIKLDDYIKFKDSVEWCKKFNIDSTKREKLDSLYREKNHFEEIKSQIAKMSSVRDSLKILYDSLNQVILTSEKKYNNKLEITNPKESVKPDQVFNNYVHQYPWLKILSNIQNFDIGQISPLLSHFTLNGIILRGGHISYRRKKIGVELIIGKSMSIALYNYQDDIKGRKFEVPLYGTKISYNSGNNSYYIIASGTGMVKDFRSAPDNFILNNQVYSFGIKQKLLNKIHFETDIAKSFSNHPGITAFDKGISTSDFPTLFSTALESRLIYSLNDLTRVIGRYRIVNPAYYFSGAPFLLNDIKEIEIDLSKRIFKKQILIGINAKKIEDNLANIKPFTTKLEGVGVSAQTMITNMPNIFINYQPYQQGNNHPDPLINIFSYTSVMNVGLVYNKQFKSFSSHFLFNYIDGNIIQGNLIDVRSKIDYKTVIFNSNITLKNKSFLNFSISSSNTTPQIDSASNAGISIVLGKMLGKKINASSEFSYYRYTQSSFQSSLHLKVQYISSHDYILEVEQGAGRINNLWGNDKKNIAYGKIIFRYILK